MQYLANEFWPRWKREFLLTLQERSKCCAPRRNLAIGDIVLIKDDNLPRNAWQLGMVTATVVNDDGLVHTVMITVGIKTLDESGRRDKPLPTVEQPIHKVMLLHKTEIREVSTEEL